VARETGPETGRRVVTDLDAMRALAHPQRSAILKLLMAGPPRTATECAAIVRATPSACSYHLRELQRFGFVERDDSPTDAPVDARIDARLRRWRAAAVGFTLGARPLSGSTPEERAVFAAVLGADRAENERLAREFVETVTDLPSEWQDAAEFSTYELALTPDELSELARQIDDLLRPHRVGVKRRPAASARTVHIAFDAFPRPDQSVPGTPVRSGPNP
jgi:DNA-binding transcriptional ArsR family regulator